MQNPHLTLQCGDHHSGRDRWRCLLSTEGTQLWFHAEGLTEWLSDCKPYGVSGRQALIAYVYLLLNEGERLDSSNPSTVVLR